MLQQTQVATVIPYFRRFLNLFPTLGHLASADEQEVLRAWQGLGYYSRARNLHRLAGRVMAEYGGVIPSDVAALKGLPGIGCYTAGAIASIAYGKRAPILDGNVRRILCRIDAIDARREVREEEAALWRRAEEILPSRACGDFNSALMELGEVICTSRSPRCLTCPVNKSCEAHKLGIAARIPSPRRAAARPIERRWVFCIQHGDKWQIAQRPKVGRWASMWQFPTAAQTDVAITPATIARLMGLPILSAKPLMTFSHTLTHRHYEFAAFHCKTKASSKGVWVTLDELRDYPLPRPHVIIAAELRRASLA